MARADKEKRLERSSSRLLIVDPQPAVRQVLGDFLANFYHLSLAGTGEGAIARLDKQQIDLILLDEGLVGKVTARDLIRHTDAAHGNLPVIVLSNRRARDSGEVGPCSFLPKKTIGSEVGRSQLLLLIERKIRDFRQERASLFARRQSSQTGADGGSFLVGKSDTIETIREQAQLAAKANLNLLITGETGVGKTFVAENVHYLTQRAGVRPFVSLDPSTLAPTLFEAELFGHARGAYTGAVRMQIGAFEAADGGTLLLDEIGDLPADLQRKLLQAVEERVIRRVGEMREIHLSVRLIAATNRNLEQDVESGRFRADLFQRLNEQRMHIPPLRERKEDIVPLLGHFLSQFCPGVELAVAPAAQSMLEDHDWPGNVRELRTLARRLNAAEVKDEIREENLVQILPARLDRGDESALAPEERIRVFGRRTYLQALQSHEYNIRATARALDLAYHTLRSRLRSLDLLDLVKENRKRKGKK